MIPEKLNHAIAGVLKDEARKGQTTKQGATLLVMNKIARGGGPQHYGVGRAELHMALTHIVGNAIGQQLKAGLPDNVIHYAISNAPPALVQSLPKLPAWIATGEGPSARWVPSLKASSADWMANAKLKKDKARQTLKQADVSADIARYLDQYGLVSLSDVLAEAAE